MIESKEGLVAFRTICPGGRKGFDVVRVSGRYFPIFEPVALIAGTDEKEALAMAQEILDGQR